MRFSPFSLLLLLLWAACTGDKKEEQPTSLNGTWIVQNATRAGDATPLLNGTWFSFSEKGEMDTNIPSLEGQTPYEYSKGVIQKKGRVPVDFAVKNLTDTSLVLSFEMRGQTFKLLLKKGEKQDIEEPIEDSEPAPTEPEQEPAES